MPSLAFFLYYLALYYPSPFVLLCNTGLLKYMAGNMHQGSECTIVHKRIGGACCPRLGCFAGFFCNLGWFWEGGKVSWMRTGSSLGWTAEVPSQNRKQGMSIHRV